MARRKETPEEAQKRKEELEIRAKRSAEINTWKPKNKEIVRKPADRRWGKGILFQLKAKFHILIKEILV